MSALHLPNPSAGTDAVTLQDGRQLLVYNHSVRKGGKNGRQILNVAISKDGIKWKPVMTLEKESNRAGYSYPAVIQADDGKGAHHLHVSASKHKACRSRPCETGIEETDKIEYKSTD